MNKILKQYGFLIILLLSATNAYAQFDQDGDRDYDLYDWSRERHQDRLELQEQIHRNSLEWETFRENQLLQEQNNILRDRNRHY